MNSFGSGGPEGEMGMQLSAISMMGGWLCCSQAGTSSHLPGASIPRIRHDP